ncbi:MULTISPECIES: Crp/Fnr family transcriptional regulator [Niastella]|uniref:Crp/Fnr family transcriptional regulator n=1 Tax=Niastella soli TaxID=2821487 RepID=A0ABS3YZB4_9BACT|nr:Crp/Fnr family transcriptional regulator [Niastella soli]MBO9202735.1 Crp/Fnr family transcriptional regulator [Niastella soli]
MGDNNIVASECFEQLLVYLQRFSTISREGMVQIMPYLEIRQFEKKKKLVNLGEMEDYMNMVIKGLVRKYVPSSIRGEVTLQLATEGHFIQSEISFHHRVPSEVVIQTLEPTVLASIHHERMKEAMDKFPEAEQLARTIIMQMFIKKDARYFDQLNTSTRDRFIDYMNNHPHMLQRVPQKILASYLNIKPETFSRLKHLLLQKK